MRALAALLAAVLVACGGGPMAPELCSELEDVTLYAGEQGRVTLCYVGDDYPAIEVESSDPEIVDVSFRVDTRVVGLFAHSPGEAKVTVTAYGADDAVGEQTFQVIVPNRAPEVVGVLDPATMVPGVQRRWELDGLFDEPDNQALQYAASSSNTAIATASVTETLLTLDAQAVGTAEITVTASDGELGTPAAFNLVVVERSVAYAETFDDDSHGWQPLNLTGRADSKVRTRDGALEVWSGGSTPVPGGATIEREIPYFDIRAKVRPAPRRSGTLVSLALLLDSDVYTQVEVMLTDNGEYVVWAVKERESEQWDTGAFNADPDSFTDVRWWYEGGRYRVEFSNERDTRRITIPPENSHPELGTDLSPTLTRIALFAHHLGDRSGEANRVRLDEITVRGAVLGAQRAATTLPTWRRIR